MWRIDMTVMHVEKERHFTVKVLRAALLVVVSMRVAMHCIFQVFSYERVI
ncbi:hypothetical protein BLEM_2281 [Bifidobacterium lemurum]|uniref:Uncharacterized protein n=1 Tax=Bifidobacterium lemurum TaxID=1603886 RepID=A0A261FJX3_9BIFI|nr:hypothetical protein BLEM_2281 [Bifidobacterium lemurum]